MKVYLRSSIGSHEDPILVRRFIEHYKSLGIEDFFICLNEKGRGDAVRQTLLDAGVSVSAEWKGGYSEYIRLEKLNQMIESLNSEDWVLSADADELQRYPESLSNIIEKSEDNGHEWIKGGIVDRFALGGIIPPTLCPETPLELQFPLKGSVHKLKKGLKNCTRIDGYEGNIFQPKIVLHKKKRTLSRGFHGLGDFNKQDKRALGGNSMRIQVDHFKWHGNVLQKLIDIQKEDLVGPKLNKSGKDYLISHIKEEKKMNLECFSIKKVGV
jgi:hypothetical protein